MTRARRQALVPEGSERARKIAGSILQVIAGIATPQAVCEAIGVSVNRYYQLEAKGLRALVGAMEPLPRGRSPRPGAELERLAREKATAEREASRYQALYRAGQRALGLASPVALARDSKGKRRRRRHRAKALIAALETTPGPGTGEPTP